MKVTQNLVLETAGSLLVWPGKVHTTYVALKEMLIQNLLRDAGPSLKNFSIVTIRVKLRSYCEFLGFFLRLFFKLRAVCRSAL